MVNESIRERVVKERPEDAFYLRAYFALVDLSKDYENKHDTRKYEVNKLIHKLAAIYWGR